MSWRELDKLDHEHHHLLELLDVLERQFDSLDHGGTPDWRILADLVAYLVEHPDSEHERFEQQLLRRLALRAPERADVSEALTAAHRQLMDEGRQLYRLVDGILNNQVIPRASITALGHRFIGDYRRLIARETDQLFPMLGRHLRASDWLELVTERHWSSDLAGSRERRYDTDYEALCRCIARQAGDSWPPVAAESARCPVCDEG